MSTKPYIFNQETIENLYDLSQAYIKHFDDAMHDVSTNGKALFKFIKSRVNDKDKLKEYTKLFEYTRYSSNLVTFLIFYMSDKKDVYIGGVKMDLLTYLQALRENPNPTDNILFGFLEDSGLSKVFAESESDQKLLVHSKAIEKNFRDPLTYKYLVSYYNHETKESLEGKIRSIAISNEENFRRFTRLAHDESFLLSLAHKVGFTDVIEALQDTNPTFRILKVLYKTKEIEEEFLRRILDDTFFFWMLDNFDKYSFKPKAFNIYMKYLDVKREYDKYISQITAKRISKISFENYVDINKTLYDNYLSFVYAYKNGWITIRRKYEPERYEPNKPYANTFVTPEYTVGKVVKLYNPHAKQATEDGVSLDKRNDIYDDVSKDEPIVYDPYAISDGFDTSKTKTTLKKQAHFLISTVTLAILAMIPLVLMIVFYKLGEHGKFVRFYTNYGYFLQSAGLYITISCYVLTVGIALGVFVFNKKSQFANKQFKHLNNDVESHTFIEKDKISYREEKDKFYKKAKRSYTFNTFLVLVFYSGLVVFVATFLYLSLCALIPSLNASVEPNKYYFPFAAGISIGLLYGLFFQKKNIVSLIAYSVLVFVTSLLILFFI